MAETALIAKNAAQTERPEVTFLGTGFATSLRGRRVDLKLGSGDPRREVATAMASRIRAPEKKMLPCLRCRKIILTDKYHRFCRRCRNANLRDGAGRLPMRVVSGGIPDEGVADTEW